MGRWNRRGSGEPLPAVAGQGSEPAPAPARAPEPPVADWRGLPPLQRVLDGAGPFPTPDAFGASLASWQDPRFIAPLGHFVLPDGPSGEADGLSSPADVPSGGSTGTLRTWPSRTPAPADSGPAVQRRAGTPPITPPGTPPATPAARELSAADQQSLAEPPPIPRYDGPDPDTGPVDPDRPPAAAVQPTLQRRSDPVPDAGSGARTAGPTAGARQDAAAPPAARDSPVRWAAAVAVQRAGIGETPTLAPAAPDRGPAAMPSFRSVRDLLPHTWAAAADAGPVPTAAPAGGPQEVPEEVPSPAETVSGPVAEVPPAPVPLPARTPTPAATPGVQHAVLSGPMLQRSVAAAAPAAAPPEPAGARPAAEGSVAPGPASPATVVTELTPRRERAAEPVMAPLLTADPLQAASAGPPPAGSASGGPAPAGSASGGPASAGPAKPPVLQRSAEGAGGAPSPLGSRSRAGTTPGPVAPTTPGGQSVPAPDPRAGAPSPSVRDEVSRRAEEVTPVEDARSVSLPPSDLGATPVLPVVSRAVASAGLEDAVPVDAHDGFRDTGPIPAGAGGLPAERAVAPVAQRGFEDSGAAPARPGGEVAPLLGAPPAPRREVLDPPGPGPTSAASEGPIPSIRAAVERPDRVVTVQPLSAARAVAPSAPSPVPMPAVPLEVPGTPSPGPLGVGAVQAASTAWPAGAAARVVTVQPVASDPGTARIRPARSAAPAHAAPAHAAPAHAVPAHAAPAQEAARRPGPDVFTAPVRRALGTPQAGPAAAAPDAAGAERTAFSAGTVQRVVAASTADSARPSVDGIAPLLSKRHTFTPGGFPETPSSHPGSDSVDGPGRGASSGPAAGMPIPGSPVQRAVADRPASATWGPGPAPAGSGDEVVVAGAERSVAPVLAQRSVSAVAADPARSDRASDPGPAPPPALRRPAAARTDRELTFRQMFAEPSVQRRHDADAPEPGVPVPDEVAPLLSWPADPSVPGVPVPGVLVAGVSVPGVPVPGTWVPERSVPEPPRPALLAADSVRSEPLRSGGPGAARVQRSVPTDAGASPHRGGEAASSPRGDAAPPRRGHVAPLLSGWPAGPSADPEAGTAASTHAIAVQRASTASAAAAPGGADLPARGAYAPPMGIRVAARPTGAPEPAPAPSMSFQRMFADPERPRPPQRSPAADSPAEAAIAAGVARDGGDGSVVFEAPPGYGSDGGAPAVQRADESVQAVATGPAAQPAAPPGPPPAELDPGSLEELAARLFDPLVARLRAELWLDRERAGMSADTWR
jgi:hypothetical protein